MTIAASLYDWLKLLHIVAAMIWVGGAVTFSALAAHVLRRAERDTISGFVASLAVIGPLILAPAMIAVLGLGIWLVLDSDAWDFGQAWVQLALGLFAAALVLGAAFQGRAATAAGRAAAAGDAGEAGRQLRRWAGGTLLILLLTLVATWDMVVKPGL
jgi:uncharacterized membrane protein